MTTPQRITSVYLCIFAALVLIITTVRSEQVDNLLNPNEFIGDSCAPGADFKKLVGQNLIKEANKPSDPYYCHKEPFIQPLYHISESPYTASQQSVYYYPKDYDSAEDNSSTQPSSAAPNSFSTHYRLVQHILNDSAKSLKNTENIMWWNPGTAKKPQYPQNCLLLSDLEARFRSLPPPSDNNVPEVPSQSETVSEETDSGKESSEKNEQNPPMDIKVDVVYTNEDIVKQSSDNEDVAKPSQEPSRIVPGQTSECEEAVNNEPTASSTDEQRYRREKEIYAKLLGSVLAMCRNISQQLAENGPNDQFGEAPVVQQLQVISTRNATSVLTSNLISTSNATSVLTPNLISTSNTTSLLTSNLISTSNATSVITATIENSTKPSERNESESKRSVPKENALNSLHSEKLSCEPPASAPQNGSVDSPPVETISVNSTEEVSVITLSNGKHIKQSQVIAIVESAANRSETIMTIPKLLSGPLDKYQHVVDNFPNSFPIDNAFVHLPNDLLVPYDTYKEVIDKFGNKSETSPSNSNDILLNSGRHLDANVVARIIASTVFPQDSFIVLKGGTIVPYEIYRDYIDCLSQEDKENVDILISQCPCPLRYTVYEEVVNSYLNSNTTDNVTVNRLVHLWDSDEEVALNTFLAVLNNANRQEDITVTLPNKDVVPLAVYNDILDKLSVSYKQHSNVNLPNSDVRLSYSLYKEIVDKYVNSNVTGLLDATKSNSPSPLAPPRVYILSPISKGLLPVPLPTDAPTAIPELNENMNKSYCCYPLHYSRHVNLFPMSPAPPAV